MLLEALLVVDICIMHPAAACEVYHGLACTELAQARPHDVTSHHTSIPVKYILEFERMYVHVRTYVQLIKLEISISIFTS